MGERKLHDHEKMFLPQDPEIVPVKRLGANLAEDQVAWFDPKEDITAYELAKAMEFLLCQLTGTWNRDVFFAFMSKKFAGLSLEVSRHFEVING